MTLFTRIEIYEEKLKNSENQQRLFEKKSRTNGFLRLSVAILFITLIFNPASPNNYLINYLAYSILIATFIFLLLRHKRILNSENEYSVLCDLNRESIKKVTGEWKYLELSNTHKKLTEKNRVQLFNDINILGKNSLLQYIHSLNTQVGHDIFINWVNTIPSINTILSRQESIKELSGQLELRQLFQLEIRKHFPRNSKDKTSDESSYKSLINWSNNNESKNLPPTLARSMLFISTLFPLSLFLIYLTPDLYFIPIFFLTVNIIFFLKTHTRVSYSLDKGDEIIGELKRYLSIIKVFNTNEYKSHRLISLREEINNSHKPSNANSQIEKLSNLLSWSELRHSGMAYIIVNSFFSANCLISMLIDSWKTNNKSNIEKWIYACGEIELLFSLSEIGYNNPEWCYPETNKTTSSIEAKEISHPFINKIERVSNDISIGPIGKSLLITGSNMSGKSTLLRAVGINLALMRLGAPVCAKHFKAPTVDLLSSFRANDSLMEGISLFMAELRQISSVIEKVKYNNSKNTISVVLFDEILQGTNSKERTIAVIHIVKELIRNNCIPVITTHDLDLASEPSLKHVFMPIHFKENISEINGSISMSFDYKARNGISNTTNAIKLIQAVGIKDGEVIITK